MSRVSLTKAVIGAAWLKDGLIANADGTFSKALEMDPLSSGGLEEGFAGPLADQFFAKLGDLLTRLPNLFEGQIVFSRKLSNATGVPGLNTNLYLFEKTPKADGYSHLGALVSELKGGVRPLSRDSWYSLLGGYLGHAVADGKIPDLVWEKDHIKTPDGVSRVLSLTELPQLTWKGCLQPIFEGASPKLVEIPALSLRLRSPVFV